ncbi:unnamed protein product [Ectocarpus sp. CCAP 1310/34]|nr:unnamed protein product [Ectocarpus sp. CCAP 1310/34]
MVSAAVATAETSGGRGCLCTGRVLSHGWAFMCTDTGVLAWEQGMVAAERPGAAVRADQVCLRFEHPAMMHELALMAPLGGKIAVGFCELLSGMSATLGMRVSKASGRGALDHFRAGARVFQNQEDGGIPARVVRLTTDILEVWSVGGGGGTPCLEVCHPLASQIQRALGVRQACLLDVAVTGAPTTVSPSPASGEASASPPVVSWGLELLVLAAAGAAGGSGRYGDGGAEGGGGDGRELSVHAVRVSSGEASWVGSSVSVQVISSHHVTTTSATATAEAVAAARRGRQPAFPAAAPNPPAPASLGPGCRRATLVADNEQAFSTGDGTRVGGGGGGIVAHVFWPSSPSPDVSVEGGGTATAQVWSVCVKAWGGDGASGGGGGGEEVVEWEERGSVTVSSRAALSGGCVGGGGALLGCPGVVLLSRQGQAVWVAPRHTESPAAAAAAGLAVDLGPCPEVFASIPGNDTSEEWKMALVEGGLRAFEEGKTMDPTRLAMGSLLGRAAQETGRGAMASTENIDSAIVRAGLEVLNGSWRHPSAFASPHQLVHLALREKARRQRALVRVLMDAGAWGALSVGRAALSECGEKVAAASRLCELQDSISRKHVGAKAAGLLEDCVKFSLRNREARSGAAAAVAVTSERDRYFEHTQGVLDAFVELHTPRLDEVAPSSSIDGASRTPLAKALLFDSSLEEGDRLPLLDHVSVVIAGVFEAALRHRASERSVYRSGLRGKLWTASSEARLVLFRQLLAYNGSIDGICLQGPGAAGGGGGGGGGVSREATSGVIERLSVLLLDGFKEEKDANPAASGRVEWEKEYTNSKKLCVEVVAACGREDLALELADIHGYPEGTVAICHKAEGRKPGCRNGHRLLRQRMEGPRRRFEGRGQEEEGKAADGGGVESRESRAERQTFARFVLDWHLRHGYKTALLQVGEVVPDMLCEFLADWKEAELLWIFQARSIRRGDYTGARRALARGSPPANQKGGKCEAQHLWLSLAKLANLAGGSGDDGPNASSDPVTVDLVRGGEIQRRLELAEVREKLIESLPANDAMDAMINGDEPWGWKDALEESTSQLNSLWQGGPAEESEEGGVAGVLSVVRAADIAFQGYRALVAGLPEQSYLHADSLWREVIGLTLTDPHVKEAVAKGAMPSASEDRTAVSDREMEASRVEAANRAPPAAAGDPEGPTAAQRRAVGGRRW